MPYMMMVRNGFEVGDHGSTLHFTSLVMDNVEIHSLKLPRSYSYQDLERLAGAFLAVD